MWEKCVGCGEGLFAGDAFCGNCGRPVTPAVPAAREPDGLESAHLPSPAADRGQVRVIPAQHAGAAGQAAPDPSAPVPSAPVPSAPEHSAPRHSAPAQDLAWADQAAQENAAALEGPAQFPGDTQPGGMARPKGTTRRAGASRRAGPGWPDIPDPRDGTVARAGAVPRDDAGRPPRRDPADDGAPGTAMTGRRAAAKLSGPATLDPARNPRYLLYVLRQAGVFTGIYLLIETVLLLCLLLAAAAGTRLGPALRLELGSLWLVALVLAIPFWLIPVPALLAEWSRVMEQGSEAAQTAFEHITSAFQADGTPVDSLRVRTASRHQEGDREYLELRRDHFSGYISCFAHGHDLYVGWTFWLHMSPLRLLMMVIGRNIQDVTSRGDGIHRSLRFESTRALMAAMHGATLAGIDAASSELGPAGPQLSRETAIDMNVKAG